MEEQKTVQPEQSSYDVSADGAAYTGYEEETLPETPAGDPSASEQPAIEPEELPPDGVRVNEDGDIDFGEDFFGDLKDSPETPEQPEPPEAETQKYYTDEELRQIPFQE